MKRKSGQMTLKDVAELAGTSVSTVSRVLSDHPKISADTKERVMKVVKKVGFELNPAARALAGGRTGMIGVLASNIGSGFYAEVIHGIDAMTRWKMGHILCSFESKPESYAQMLKKLASSGQVDGVILVAPPVELFSYPFEVNVPVVLCSSVPPVKSDWKVCDSIDVDHAGMMEQLVDHLVSKGCTRLLHVAGPSTNFSAQQRKAAFQEIIQRYPTVTGNVVDATWEKNEICALAEQVMQDNENLPEGIIAWNDSTALGFLEVMKSYPDPAKHIRITGWDNEPMDEVLGLTSVQIPMREMGEHAARMLYHRLDGTASDDPVRDVFSLKLMPRSSSS